MSSTTSDFIASSDEEEALWSEGDYEPSSSSSEEDDKTKQRRTMKKSNKTKNKNKKEKKKQQPKKKKSKTMKRSTGVIVHQKNSIKQKDKTKKDKKSQSKYSGWSDQDDFCNSSESDEDDVKPVVSRPTSTRKRHYSTRSSTDKKDVWSSRAQLPMKTQAKYYCSDEESSEYEFEEDNGEQNKKMSPKEKQEYETMKSLESKQIIILSSDDESSDQEEKMQPKKKLNNKRKCKLDKRNSSNSDETGKCQTKRKCLKKITPSPKRKRLKKLKEVQTELKELQKDLKFWGDIKEKEKEADEYKENTSVDDKDDDNSIHLPIEPLCPNCLDLMKHQKTNKDGKLFFSCTGMYCNEFMWPDEAYINLPGGMNCDCGKPSYPRTTEHVTSSFGESFGVWKCAKTTGGCDFALPIANNWYDRRDQVCTIDSCKPCNPVSNIDEQFLVGAASKSFLQDLFHVNYEDSNNLDAGRGYYDYLQVHRAWRVSPPTSSVEAANKFRESQKHCGVRTELRYDDALQDLLLAESGILDPLDSEANEVILLHGTTPHAVANILEQGLDPSMARMGLFGRGTYFAEHPAKINQYTQVDQRWMGNSRDIAMSRAHKKLYPNSDLHGGNIYYALVCRVVLGKPDSIHAFRSRGPKPGHHSLIAQNGNGSYPNYREFVIFNKEAIKIEYIVAYKRIKHYCSCGIPVRERTMNENGRERPLIACSQSRKNDFGKWVDGCGLVAALPRCFCHNYRTGDFYGAKAKLSDNLYCCRIKRCDFSVPIDLEHCECEDFKKDDDDETLGGFIVPG